MKFIVLEPLDIEVRDSNYVRRCNIKRIDGDVQVA